MNNKLILMLVCSGGGLHLSEAKAEEGEPFPASSTVAAGWSFSPWWGFYYDAEAPWYFQFDTGWVYHVEGNEATGLVLYDPQVQTWAWIHLASFPRAHVTTAPTMAFSYPVGLQTAPEGMVYVAGGDFFMEERPTTVSSFSIAQYPTTLGLWLDVRASAVGQGYDLAGRGSACGTDHPVNSINWYDVVKWCNARSERDGLEPVYYTDTAHAEVYRSGEVDLTPAHVKWEANGYRLPTEAEHWFAQRGGLRSRTFSYAGSNNAAEAGWYIGNSSGAPCNIQDGRGSWPVGQKVANELGLFDMSGNVWEASFDWHAPFPNNDHVVDPRGPNTGTVRAGRGGSWLTGETAMQTWLRGWAPPAPRNPLNGFRVVRSAGASGE